MTETAIPSILSNHKNSLVSRIIFLGATGFGVGCLPIAPGTFGSLLGVPLFFYFRQFSGWVQIVAILLFSLLAIGTADWVARIKREDDPSCIVIDEVVGMWVTLLFLWRADWLAVLIGFFLFRAFDILKFFPISLFETFRGGVGIVLDDIAAGMLANIGLRVILLTVLS